MQKRCSEEERNQGSMEEIEIWSGLECTLNRVRNRYFDQLKYTGHYERGTADIDLIGTLGITRLRYPVLWEKHLPKINTHVDWSFTRQSLERLVALNIKPIVGLVHHGSGPKYVNFFDGSFETGLAAYAGKVAQEFPWIEYYTPVNEPLTTARFCGLYGHWYPHGKSDFAFYKVLISECKAIVMSMAAIRKINPQAKLIQTEDLAKTYSTPLLKYQADFENCRRWLSYDLICGKVDEAHPLWSHMLAVGITAEDLNYFADHNCSPDIAGFNYYIVSERYLDHVRSRYPVRLHGGNGRHKYADVEVVRVAMQEPTGAAVLLREAWDHLQLPLAITECHLHCTSEEQARWFHYIWEVVRSLQKDGVDIRAITAWATFGLAGWDKLVKRPWGKYEPGIFDLSSGTPAPTAIAELIPRLSRYETIQHTSTGKTGWWERPDRILYKQKQSEILPDKKSIDPLKVKLPASANRSRLLVTNRSEINKNTILWKPKERFTDEQIR
jgi:dTDP-4-dehydrorhamnose reductase